MKNFIVIIQNEFRHFARNPFKTVSLILFICAAFYGLQNGYSLFSKHNNEIAAIKNKNAETVKKISKWFDEGKKGPEDQPWIDVTTPFWAIWNAPSVVVKTPSPLMPFSIGQAEQFGYYKNVTNWSTTFDSDLAEEIANPERLLSGTIDFSFVVLYLLPVLTIILLFNIGGLEKDLGFDRMILINHNSKMKWLLARHTFYFILLIIVMLLLLLPYALITGALQNDIVGFIKLSFYILLYLLFWFSIFYIINLSSSGSAGIALKMIATWLLFCVLIPGTIHQIASLKYPPNYMTDYIRVNRDEVNKLRKLSLKTQREMLIKTMPELLQTKYGKDTTINEDIISKSASALANDLTKKAAQVIEAEQEQKNIFIRSFYSINPVVFFQNKINAIAGNDYYAYKKFRSKIQAMIDKKINTALMDCWNKEVVTKEKYLKYVEQFKQHASN